MSRHSWQARANAMIRKRDDNEGDIIRALNRAGASVVQLPIPVDLLVWFRGGWFPMEVKMPNGKLTMAQENFCRLFKVPVVHTAVEALRAIGAIKPDPRVDDALAKMMDGET